MIKNKEYDNVGFFDSEEPTLLGNLLYAIAYPKALTADFAEADVMVDVGTTLANAKAKLPTTVTKRCDGIPVSYEVAWGASTTPTYDATSAGTYAINGTISQLPSYITNSGGTTYKTTANIVVAGTSTGNDFKSFKFVVDNVDKVGTINTTNHTVAVTVPADTAVTALIATFTATTNASVKVGTTSQVSGTTANDFTNAVTYTITSESGTAQTWTVTVTVAS